MSQGLPFIRIPIYNVGGWYDIFNTGNVYNFTWLQNQGSKGARGNQKLYMGPFGHGPLSGDLAYPGADNMMANADQELRWWDYWLKGKDNGIIDEPPVHIVMMASAEKGAFSPKNRSMALADWPPNSREVRFYPTADHGLATHAPTLVDAKITYKDDPANPVPTVGGANLTFERGPMDQRAIKDRPDYLRFETQALDKDVAIAGHVSVEVWGATDGPDTDFMAKLVDVYPDGYEALVLDGPVRARYRDGRLPDQVRMMTPNAPEPLTIDLRNTAITFEKGHHIELVITSSNAPEVRGQPDNNGGQPRATPPRHAAHGGQHRSTSTRTGPSRPLRAAGDPYPRRREVALRLSPTWSGGVERPGAATRNIRVRGLSSDSERLHRSSLRSGHPPQAGRVTTPKRPSASAPAHGPARGRLSRPAERTRPSIGVGAEGCGHAGVVGAGISSVRGAAVVAAPASRAPAGRASVRPGGRIGRLRCCADPTTTTSSCPVARSALLPERMPPSM